MRKFLSSILCLAFLCFNVSSAYPMSGAMNGLVLGQVQTPLLMKTDLYTKYMFLNYGGLTFYKDFSKLAIGMHAAGDLNAEYAGGSAVATFTATRSATNPATYVDDNGIIQLTTDSDLARIQAGYYDDTGFHAQKGLMIEGSGTNLLVNGVVDDNSAWSTNDLQYSGTTRWKVAFNNSATATLGISSVSKYIKSALIIITNQGTGGSSNDIQFYSSDMFTLENATNYTLSFYIWANATKTIPVQILEGDDDFTQYALGNISTIANTWTRVAYTFQQTTGGQVTDAIMKISLGNNGLFTIALDCLQVEQSPYATSFIPTTTAALTRNAEALKYAIAGNRTAASESMFVAWCPIIPPIQGGGRILLDSNTKQRLIQESAGGARHVYFPNVTDSSGCIVGGKNNLSAGTTYTYTNICTTSGSTHAYFYIDGSLSSNNPTDTDNYTANAWGTYWYLGSSNARTNQQNACFESIAFFSDAKDATSVSQITNILNQ